MGYTTNFEGELSINPPLDEAQVAYINKFSETRRMIRNARVLIDTEKYPDPLREAVGLELGEDGQYYVGSDNDSCYNGKDKSIIDSNMPSKHQPGLWCNWIVSDQGDRLMWNGGEKFYYYVRWLQYLINHFFVKWSRILNGDIKWQGEDINDKGIITVVNNQVTTHTDDDI